MKRHEITERAQQLAAIPATERRLRCTSACRFLLVDRDEVRGRRTWRCEDCLRYLDAPISREHERLVAKTPRAPLPDQLMVFDVIDGE